MSFVKFRVMRVDRFVLVAALSFKLLLISDLRNQGLICHRESKIKNHKSKIYYVGCHTC